MRQPRVIETPISLLKNLIVIKTLILVYPIKSLIFIYPIETLNPYKILTLAAKESNTLLKIPLATTNNNKRWFYLRSTDQVLFEEYRLKCFNHHQSHYQPRNPLDPHSTLNFIIQPNLNQNPSSPGQAKEPLTELMIVEMTIILWSLIFQNDFFQTNSITCLCEGSQQVLVNTFLTILI